MGFAIEAGCIGDRVDCATVRSGRREDVGVLRYSLKELPEISPEPIDRRKRSSR